MPSRPPIKGPAAYADPVPHNCPQCGGVLSRTARRPIDRLTSLFVPAHRYRCRSFSCQWVGNLPSSRDAANAGRSPLG